MPEASELHGPEVRLRGGGIELRLRKQEWLIPARQRRGKPVMDSDNRRLRVRLIASRSGKGGSRLKVGSVVIDCNDFDAMVAFWREALRYVLRDPPEDDFVVLQDAHGTNVNVSISKVPEPRVGKNRLHLDLYTDDQPGEVERLLKLGARIHPRTPEEGEDFIVLEDPEGNLFCVIDKSD